MSPHCYVSDLARFKSLRALFLRAPSSEDYLGGFLFLVPLVALIGHNCLG